MQRALFIYYRVDPDQAPQAAAAVAELLRDLRARHPGLRARLWRRTDPDTLGLQTWMETYELDPDAFAQGIDCALQGEIQARAAMLLGPWLAGPRQVEVFAACAS